MPAAGPISMIGQISIMPMMRLGESGTAKFILLLKSNLETNKMAARKRKPAVKKRQPRSKSSLVERAKKINPRSERNWFARLSDQQQEDLTELREAFLDGEFPKISIYKIYTQLIEDRYGCCYSTFVHWLRTGKTYK